MITGTALLPRPRESTESARTPRGPVPRHASHRRARRSRQSQQRRQVSGTRRRARRGLWLVTAPAPLVVAGAAGLRWAVVPKDPVLIGLQGMSALLMTAAVPVVMRAVLRPTPWRVSAAMLSSVAALLAFSGDLGSGHAQAMPAGTSVLRLASANLLLDNADPAATVRNLVAENPDLILVQELTPQGLEQVLSHADLNAYPHRVLDPRPGGFGSAIFSRLPLQDGPLQGLRRWPITSAVVEAGGRPVEIINVHLAAPLSSDGVWLWARQIEDLADYLAPPDGVRPTPVIAMGDYNAAQIHRPMRELLARGPKDAFDVAGRGLGLSWPQLPAGLGLLRIDHAIVAGGVLVKSAKTGSAPGSDHRSLVVELGVPPAE